MRTAVFAVALALTAPAAASVPIPPLTGPVVDTAGVVDPSWMGKLEALCRAARAQKGGRGVQLQYLIVPALEGEPIESYSIRVAEAWKIGSKGLDNGVLVAVAMHDRAVRIEVGGGLEGELTDAQSGRIIRDTIVPAFRTKSYGEGLYDAGTQILAALGALPRGIVSPGRAPPSPGSAFGGLGLMGFVIALILLRIIMGFGTRRRGFWLGPTGWGGRPGGDGWGGGGGGGWGGGGGGFSGGGASGRW